MIKEENNFNRLWSLLKLKKKDITAIYFYAILSGILDLSLPLGIQAIIGFVIGASMVTSIYVLIFIVVLGVLIVGILQINQLKIIEKIQQSIFLRYAFEFADTIPKLDLKKIDNYYLPEKVNSFFETVSLQKGISKILIDIPLASIQILFGLILLSLYHPIFIVFGLVLLIILGLILKLTSKSGLLTSFEESKYKYAVASWLEELSRVLRSFKFSQNSSLNLKNTDKNMVGYLSARTAHFKVLLIQYKSLVFFKVAITTIMLTVGVYLLLNQQLNIGEFIAAEIVILSIVTAVEKLINSLDNIYDVITALGKLATITEGSLELDGSIILDSKNTGLSIQMINCSFGYQTTKATLDQVSLQIPANSKVCISGKEGSGKSTLLRVISGNYKDFDGSILINNIPIGNYQLDSLRSITGKYFNQLDIFMGTIWENISMGNEKITYNLIDETAQKIGFGAFLNLMPLGYDTIVDPLGKKLPTNLIKKILLLRALVNSPNLLLLEEPWQGLEENLQAKIMHYILNEVKNATILVVSDHKKFAAQCDYQIELADGSVQNNKNK